MDAEQLVISQTECWIRKVIIGLKFCPFAKRELERKSIRYSVVDSKQPEDCLQALVDQCAYLDNHDATETTLLILSSACIQFDDYLFLLNAAEQLLVEQGYEGTYQLASFHPDYMFADASSDDAANYTNRSPYPMFHIIRESSIERVLKHYDDAGLIPERNVRKARELGLETMKSLFADCMS